MARDSVETDSPIPDEDLAQTCDNNTHIARLYDYTIQDNIWSPEPGNTTTPTPESSQTLVYPLSQDLAKQSGTRVPDSVSTENPELHELQLDTEWPIPENFDFDFSAIFTDDSSEQVSFDPFDRIKQREEKLPPDLEYLNSRHEQLLSSKRLDIAKSHEQISLAETESKCRVELAKLKLERVKLRRAADHKGRKT